MSSIKQSICQSLLGYLGKSSRFLVICSYYLQISNDYLCSFAVLYFDGIIELALYVALKRDPQAIALHFYKCGEPRDDTQGKEAFLLR